MSYVYENGVNVKVLTEHEARTRVTRDNNGESWYRTSTRMPKDAIGKKHLKEVYFGDAKFVANMNNGYAYEVV